MVCGIAGNSWSKRHDFTKPESVHCPNAYNSRLRTVFGSELETSLRGSMRVTYSEDLSGAFRIKLGSDYRKGRRPPEWTEK